jgi:hypothetical protein
LDYNICTWPASLRCTEAVIKPLYDFIRVIRSQDLSMPSKRLGLHDRYQGGRYYANWDRKMV